MSKNVVEPEKTQKIWRMGVAYWISKQAHARARAPTLTHTHTHTHTHALTHVRASTHAQKYVILTAFHGNSGFVNVPQYYVTRILPVLFGYAAGHLLLARGPIAAL